MNPRFSATFVLVSACSALPFAHAADELMLPETQIQSTGTGAQANGGSEGYQGRPAASSTRLGLTDKETPQGITTITRDQIKDFQLNGIRDALRAAPTVTVEQLETDRTEFTSRGFTIDTFQYDGMGMPFASVTMVGELDLVEYEQVDVLHGANGLMSGSGNPSAAVNFVRKRPTDTFQATIGASAGSWDNRRVEADVSGPLTSSGNVRGRFIYAHDKGNSYLDRYGHERNVAAGLLAFDLSDADTLTVGFSQHNSDANGSSWGNLPLVDTAGNRLHYSRSANIGQPWSYWNLHTQRAFAELTHDFGNGWNGKVTVTGVTQYQDTDMYYISGVTNGVGPSYASDTSSKEHQLIGEAQVSGPFSLFGRDHQLTVGANYGRTHHKERAYNVSETGYFDTSLGDALAGDIPRPVLDYTDADNMGNFQDTQKSLYAGARFSVIDDLHWIVGARMLSADGKGENYGAAHDTREHGKVTPYTGLVYDLTDQWAVYGSWTQIYSPQYVLGTDGGLLDPLEGTSTELGVKGSLLDDRLNVTAAVFKARQENVAEYQGQVGNQNLYAGKDFKSHGVELQAAGEALPGLDLLAGYTYVRIEDDNGDEARKYVPTHTFRGMATYRLPTMPKVRVGGRLSWQSDIEAETTSAVRQDAFALVDLFTSYDIDEHWNTSLNLNNLTDRKYLMSLKSGTSANYGAPRNLTASVTWKY